MCFSFTWSVRLSPREEMGVGVVEAANPEFQVVREKRRDREEGGRVAETVQEMQCLLCKEGEGS